MHLSYKAIKEFQEITKRVFEKELSYDEAKELAENFIAFYEVIFRELPNERKI